MMLNKILIKGMVAVAVLVLATGATYAADVFNMPAGLTSLTFVPVDNAGNGNDTTNYGAVAYDYWMGTFEITAAQYSEFLNGVAKTDTYQLWIADMADVSTHGGCGIQRGGTSGNYYYAVATIYANRPVNWVTWGNAARFANWLTNGQPTTGVQDLTTTEDGSYFLNGTTSYETVTRKTDAVYVIPTQNEWYKAAYHKNDGVTSNYWDYPTGADAIPSNVLSNPNADPGNNANFNSGGYTIGSPYWRTPVGDFENSESPYGTFDQGGNVFEYLDPVPGAPRLYQAGGAYSFSSSSMSSASFRNQVLASSSAIYGFRVATLSYGPVPEPGSLILLLSGGVAVLFYWLRRR